LKKGTRWYVRMRPCCLAIADLSNRQQAIQNAQLWKMVEKRQTEKTGLRDDLSRVQKRLKQLEDEAILSSTQSSPQSGLGESSSNEGEKQPQNRRRAGTITAAKENRLQRPETGPRSYSDRHDLPVNRNRRDGRTSPLPDSEMPFRSTKESLSRIESANSSRSETSGRSGYGMDGPEEDSPSKMKTPMAARDRTRSTEEDEDTPTGKRLQAGLLPAPPMLNTPTSSEKRTTGDSRMAFEPEVREYLALAQTPPAAREAFPSIPGPSRLGSGLSPGSSAAPSRLSTPPPLGEGLPSLIPASPYSDAADNKSVTDASGFKTPDSNRPDDNTGKIERHDALSVKSAPEVRPFVGHQVDGPPTPSSMQAEHPGASRTNSSEQSNVGSRPSATSVRRQESTRKPAGAKQTHIPRLVPRLLPYTRCSIPSSRIVPNTLGKEALSFIVSIQLRPPGDLQVYNWNVAKFFSSFVELDTRIRQKMSKKELKQAKLSSLPEGRAWKDYGPAKMDRMKVGPAEPTYCTVIRRAHC
jgi:hypothetical protein